MPQSAKITVDIAGHNRSFAPSSKRKPRNTIDEMEVLSTLNDADIGESRQNNLYRLPEIPLQ